jgi:hypothetical protein
MTQNLQNIKNLIDACVQKGGFFKDADTVELIQKSFREIAYQVGEYEYMIMESKEKASKPIKENGRLQK